MKKQDKELLKKINELEYKLCGNDDESLSILDELTGIWFKIQDDHHFKEPFQEIKRLINNSLEEIKDDDQPLNLKEKYINEGWTEALDYCLKIMDIVKDRRETLINTGESNE